MKEGKRRGANKISKKNQQEKREIIMKRN